jgi:hypothetical protein
MARQTISAPLSNVEGAADDADDTDAADDCGESESFMGITVNTKTTKDQWGKNGIKQKPNFSGYRVARKRRRVNTKLLLS